MESQLTVRLERWVRTCAYVVPVKSVAALHWSYLFDPVLAAIRNVAQLGAVILMVMHLLPVRYIYEGGPFWAHQYGKLTQQQKHVGI